MCSNQILALLHADSVSVELGWMCAHVAHAGVHQGRSGFLLL